MPAIPLDCGFIYNELTPIVYSRRVFIILYDNTNGLASLQNLSDHGLKHMRDLTVVLSHERCVHKKDDSWLFTRREETYCFTRPLLLEKSQNPNEHGTKVLREWKRASEMLAARITPGRLHLQLICYVENFNTGETMVAPLAKLPVLKNCSISLGSNNGLAELARISRLRAKGVLLRNVEYVEKPFRYEYLPCEIRLIILENTGLVPGGGKICWTTKHGYSLQNSDWCLNHHDLRNSVYYYCYCNTYHASAVSKQCLCWEPPVALWQVSRAFREDALRVFFGKNRFIIMHDDKKSCMSQPSSFLSWAVPRDGLKYIRSLEVVLNGDGNSYNEDPSQYRYPHQDLVEYLERTRDDWTPLGLTLSVYIATVTPINELQSTENAISYEGKIMYDCYYSFFTALSGFRSLNRLFVYALEQWWGEVRFDIGDIEYDSGGTWDHLEKSLEQLTMGRQYGSNDVGKWPDIHEIN
ncbi:uncharacterized protein TRUGW13939_00248 [Talaromyces rugulosus]|uniref:Uncharacterized protein n=1 Tax=Talaromyces rugulosus TaxID=121627 RepID=A0A7H8QHW7_TALRU|nr:uncharacterized protein TRUGW13939_00248 [Talaromyces rugulosus]QKX53172.1 hypothetical protein TRUGW13939_00248 [Talaromyces rugulosus]